MAPPHGYYRMGGSPPMVFRSAWATNCPSYKSGCPARLNDWENSSVSPGEESLLAKCTHREATKLMPHLANTGHKPSARPCRAQAPAHSSRLAIHLSLNCTNDHISCQAKIPAYAEFGCGRQLAADPDHTPPVRLLSPLRGLGWDWRSGPHR
jgi:hypothetical protein